MGGMTYLVRAELTGWMCELINTSLHYCLFRNNDGLGVCSCFL